MGPIDSAELVRKYIKVTGVVALYWVVSISMVFLNKSLLGDRVSTEKDAPIFVTTFQCLVTAIACNIISRLAVFFPNVFSFPQVGQLEREKVKKILPLSFMFVMMMTMNNLCLKYVGVAFYYVGRSLTTVFNVIFTFIILGETTSLGAIVCCFIIIGGFWLGVDQEDAAGSLSVAGVVFGVLGSAFVSLNAIFTKKTLPVLDGSIWMLSYYNNVIAVVLFIPVIILKGELSAIKLILVDATIDYFGLLILSGIIGFAIGYVTGLQIQVTSPLTHNISGTAKACAQTILATWWYNESKLLLWWLSNFIVLGGSLGYTRVKQLLMKKKHFEERLTSEDNLNKQSFAKSNSYEKQNEVKS